MLRHKYIDRVCCGVIALCMVLSLAFAAAAGAGLVEGKAELGYESRLFDQSAVHTIDIRMEDWDGFLDTCTSEEYALCTLVIDGETYANVAIRGKGNTSLSNVAAYGNDRYSFKVEFDHYDDALTYHGLDKLSLNNLIQDKTLMKDYLAYTLMGQMGVVSPLCSYVNITVNGEPWGLYLAVEGVEDSFLTRNYGTESGDLYKPDSMSFGGGRGNGRDFDMEEFRQQFSEEFSDAGQGNAENIQLPDMEQMPQMESMTPPEDMENFDFSQLQPGGFDPFANGDESTDGSERDRFGGGRTFGERGGMGNMGGGMDGRGSSDVKLQYTDDEVSSYSNIFDNAKTAVTAADQERLIASLKTLAGDDAASAVDVDAVIRYFAVHNFLCNDDSYTGQMIHNYYLHEQDGVLSMIPWDYNLAIGGFSMGGGSASSTVNDPIDYDLADRPMVAWIFASEEYTAQYHGVYQELVDTYLESGWLTEEIARVRALIAPYVENDPTAFFTYDEFTAAADMLVAFCDARTESVAGQLAGTIPSTEEGQRQQSAALIDASHIDLSAMGEFNMGTAEPPFSVDKPGDAQSPSPDLEGGGPAATDGAAEPSFRVDGQEGSFSPSPEAEQAQEGTGAAEPPDMGQMPGGMEMPEGFDPSQMGVPGGGQMPGMGQHPQGLDPAQMGTPPPVPQ